MFRPVKLSRGEALYKYVKEDVTNNGIDMMMGLLAEKYSKLFVKKNFCNKSIFVLLFLE
jgi:hypothetical protein